MACLPTPLAKCPKQKLPYLSKSGSTFAFFFWLILLVAPPPFFIGIWKARTRTKSPLLCKTVNHIRFQSSWSLFYKEESPYCHNIDLSWSSAYHAVLLMNSFWPKFFRIVQVTLCQHQDIKIELHYSRSNVSWSIPRERDFPTGGALAVTIAARSTTPKLAHFAFFPLLSFPHFWCSLLTSAWTFGDWCRLVLKSTSRSPPPRQNYPRATNQCCHTGPKFSNYWCQLCSTCKDDKSSSAQCKLSLWPATEKKSKAKATYKLRKKNLFADSDKKEHLVKRELF